MSLHNVLYKDRPNSVIALPLAFILTYAWWDIGPWTAGVWAVVVFLWLLAIGCLWSDFSAQEY